MVGHVSRPDNLRCFESWLLSSTGIGSGLEIDSLVSELVAAERSAGQTRIDSKKTKLTEQFSAMATLMGAMSGFQSSLNSLVSSNSFKSRSVSVSDEAAFTAKATSSAAAGSYDVQVQQLAKAAQLGSDAFASGGTTVGTGTLTISVGDSSFSIEVGEGGNSLANIRDAINRSAANTGVQASLLTDVEGTHLVLTSMKTGADHALTVTASGGNGGLEQLEYDPDGSGTTNMEVRSAAQDAILFVSGYEIHSGSNTVSNAIEGVTLTLKAPTEQGSTVLLAVERDDSAIQAAAKKFVDAYNSLASTIKSLSRYDVTTGAAGTLLGDAMLRNIESQVRNLVSSPVSGVSGNYTTLASLGITTQADGTLKLDGDRFNAALDANPGAVSDIFTSNNGVAVKLADLMGTKTSVTGELTVRSSNIVGSLEDLKDQQDTLNARMKVVEQRYLKQFNALDTLLAQMNTTASSLDSWMARDKERLSRWDRGGSGARDELAAVAATLVAAGPLVACALQHARNICSLPLTRMPLRSFCSRQRRVRSRYSCIAGSSSSAGSHQASRLCSPATSSLRPVARHSARRSSSMRSTWPMHCWRAVPAWSRPSTSRASSRANSCISRASSVASCAFYLGHQGGELCAAMHGVAGWHGF